MSDLQDLYAKWLDAKTTELQQAAQSMLQSEDPEAAFRAILDEPAEERPAEQSEGNPLYQGIDPALIRHGDDGLTLPDGRTVTRAQVQEFLTSYSGTLDDDRAPTGPEVDGVELTSETAMAMLKHAEEAEQAEQQQRRAAWSAEWAAGNSAPTGRYMRLDSD